MTGAWVQRAACGRTEHPERLYPAATTSAKVTDAARRVCARCPVRADCLEDALAREDPHGIWGGLTGAERRALTRLRRATEPLVGLDEASAGGEGAA